MAATKLTHATGNIFMEQSFNDCLYSLGSTVTLASSTALSNVFSFSSRPSPRAGLPVPTGRAAPSGSHQQPPPLPLPARSLLVALPPSPRQGWEQALLKLLSHHTSCQSSLCCGLQNKPPLPPQQQHFSPAFTAPAGVPETSPHQTSASAQPQREDVKGPPRHPTTALQGTTDTLLPQTPTDLCLTKTCGVCSPRRELAATLSLTVCTGGLCSPRHQLGKALTIFVFIEGR